MIRNRKVKDPIVAITKGMSEGRSLEKALDLLPMDKIIQKGDKVMTTGGIFGKIVEINDFTVIIEVESQARLKVSKEAIVKDMTDVPAK